MLYHQAVRGHRLQKKSRNSRFGFVNLVIPGRLITSDVRHGNVPGTARNDFDYVHSRGHGNTNRDLYNRCKRAAVQR